MENFLTQRHMAGTQGWEPITSRPKAALLLPTKQDIQEHGMSRTRACALCSSDCGGETRGQDRMGSTVEESFLP